MAIGVLNVKIKFRLGARTLTMDYRKLPFQAWGELKAATSFTQRTLIAALDQLDLDAFAAVIWLERKQRERKLRYLDVYQELSAPDYNTEFEMLDVVLNDRSLSGGTDEADEDGDPTEGS